MAYYAHTPCDSDGEWHDLVEHLVAVADDAERFASVFGYGDLARACGLLHDCGKFSDEFQRYLLDCHAARFGTVRKPSPGTAEHKAVGTRMALSTLPQGTRKLAALCVLGHHGGLTSKSKLSLELAERETRTRRPDLVAGRALQSVGHLLPPSIPFHWTLPQRSADTPYDQEMLLRFAFSCLVDADSLDTERFGSPDNALLRREFPELPKVVNDWIERLSAHVALLSKSGTVGPVHRVRREVYDACIDAAPLQHGIFSLAVPTGGGKTLSSLAFALNHARANNLRRVIYVIPYTSIIDQTASVFRDILGSDAVLEHHSAVAEPTEPDAGGGKSEEARRLAAENWDAPLVVTTSVQFFESLFSNRPSRCRKLHNIARSVVILDEVQTMPLALLTPLLSGMRSLVRDFGASLVLCTATQPAVSGDSPFLKGLHGIRSIVPNPNRHFDALKRVTFRVEREPWTWEQVAKEILSQRRSSLTVLNTKKDALTLAEALAGANVRHLSTLLCGKHRRAVIDDVKAALEAERVGIGVAVHLVSTQLIEAGVDLSFPRVLRAYGPLNRIIQAAGRCNREGLFSRSESEVIVFEPADGGEPRGLYKIECQQAKLFLDRELGERDLADPDVPTDYFARLYRALDAGLDSREVQRSRAAFDFPETARKVKFIDDDTVAVFCRYDDDAENVLREIEDRVSAHLGLSRPLWRTVQPYVVAIRRTDVPRLVQAGKLAPLVGDDLYLWTAPYDPIRGIGGNVLYDPTDLMA